MNPIGIGLDVFVAAMLVAALIMGARLNTRLRALREGHTSFVKAVADLDQAAARAASGLADLRAASEDAHDQLLTRIETARGLIQKLDRLSNDGDKILAAAPASATPAAGRAMAAVAALAPRPSTQPGRATPARTPPAARSASPPRRAPFDDDLFEPDARLGPLRRKEDRR